MLCRRWLKRAGMEVAVVRGAMNAYVPGERMVVLSARCYEGRTIREWTVAAHEAGHAEQAGCWGGWAVALRLLLPGRLWLEWDANARARRMMAEEGMEADEGVLRGSWESYARPALRQTAAVGVVLAWAMIGRG